MKTALITGANSGIGYVTARELLKRDFKVLCLSRNRQRLDEAIERLREESGSSFCTGIQCDLASFTSVRGAIERVKAETDRLHLHINNAGLILSERQITEDGHEATFQINHLGPFLLTQSLLPLILNAGMSDGPSRIINVSSLAHKAGVRNFWDFKAEKTYKQFDVYGRSKLANILYAKALSRRLDPKTCTANSLHPGIIKSGFGRDGDTRGLFAFAVKLTPTFLPWFMDVDEGAQTTLHVALSEEGGAVTGQYFKAQKVSKPSGAICNDDKAINRLFDESMKLCGLS